MRPHAGDRPGRDRPRDAAKRRPWIDWIHTAQDQGAIVRPYVKWDAQPASPAAAREALFRAAWLARTAPCGPVYVNLDAAMQEALLPEALPALDPGTVHAARAGRGRTRCWCRTRPQCCARAARPLILAGRVGRGEAAWAARVALAEALGARVATDLKVGAAFPTDHPLHAGKPGVFPVPDSAAAIREADVILSLDWVDLAGTLRAAFDGAQPGARIIQVSLDHVMHNGWSSDHQGLPPVDLFLAADPDATVAALLARLPAGEAAARAWDVPRPDAAAARPCPTWLRRCSTRWATAGVAAAPAAVVGMAGSAVPPPAGLPGLRRRRRHRRRSRHLRGRGPGVAGLRAVAGLHLRATATS